MITLVAFRWVPPFAQGVVRDLRVRWALEEAGVPYRERLLAQGEQASVEHCALQPFGQIPVYEEDGLVLFESGAIVLHIAEKSEALMPRDAAGRARATAWVFAALNSIEPFVQNLGLLDLFAAQEMWAKQRRPAVLDTATERLAKLSERLGERDYLEDRFTAGDLMMTTVLRILRNSDLLQRFPNLEAYRERCEARPAFEKALADHMAPFAQYAPAA
jgi:glutathione S-transferase